MNLFERFSWMQWHGRREHHPDADILRIELDGWELILRKIGPCEPRITGMAFNVSSTIDFLWYDTPSGGTPTILPLANATNQSAVDSTGAAVAISEVVTSSDNAGLGGSDIPIGTPAFQCAAPAAGATSITVTADVKDANGTVQTGQTLEIPLTVSQAVTGFAFVDGQEIGRASCRERV